MTAATYTPTVRAALLAALDTPTHSLRRGCGGFIATGAPIRQSAPRMMPAFTRRVVNWLERDGLAEFDDPDFPSNVTLTADGIAAAQELKAAQQAKATRGAA